MAKMAAPTPPKRTTARPKRARLSPTERSVAAATQLQYHRGRRGPAARPPPNDGGYVGDRRGHPVHDANNKNATPSFRVNHNTD